MPTQLKRPSSSPARRAEVESRALAALEAALGGGTPFSEIAVESIASQAGISRSTFYLYFSDKTELLARAADRLKDLVFRSGWTVGRTGRSGGLDDYIRTLEGIVARYRDHSALLAAVNQVAQFDERVGETWAASQRRYTDWVAAILRAEQLRGMTDGSFDADLAAAILVTVANRSSHSTLRVPASNATRSWRENSAPPNGSVSFADRLETKS